MLLFVYTTTHKRFFNFHKQVFQIKLKYHCSKPIKLQKFLMQQYNIVNLQLMMAVEQFCAVSGTQLHQITCSGNRELYNLGQLVTVQGKISTFREQRQLTVDFICIHFLIKDQFVTCKSEESYNTINPLLSPPSQISLIPLVSHPSPFSGEER